ncbi:uncharacterized protein LOC133784748 [Humulus lupulus]|uniref:uncharacterized protein LOC133784748 n=1 Tax=Humulus lupulus TaxID=3486 RepID=UPI002B403A6E|nr:uncharacterized protein LOC133784748 [Humulus lupulus]
MEFCNILSWNVRGLNRKNKQMSVLDVCRLNKETTQLLHCRVRICSGNQDFCLTIVYGSNRLETMRVFWNDLAHLPLPIKPWLFLGDFNADFHVNDRIGGRPISMKEMEDAQQWLALGLVEEMKVMGPFFTCYNNQAGGNRIFSKLDSVFYNEAWLDSFPLASDFSQWEVVSDHNTFLIQDTVLNSWTKPICFGGGGLAKLVEKLVRLKHFLKRFNLSVMGDVGCHFERSKFLFQQELIKPCSLHDVKVALFSIQSVKSPFLWKDIGREVSLVVLDFFEIGKIPQSLNDTLLVLILKVDQPSKAADFRPIAYCTTIYKCISKILCRRLAKFHSSLINQNHGVFIKHRSLAYNVLIFQDLIKGYNRKNSSPRCAMKIDLSKAYDSIDLDFLENLLNALCFPSKFIRWIMICLRGGKRLRQGDPISPMLFVIVMDYLTRMLIKAFKEKGFRFHPMCKSLNLVNLCFADDLLIFCKANSQSVQILHRALAEFKSVLGLSINHNKSNSYFGGLSDIAKAPVLSCTNLIEGSFPLKCLGVPLRPTKFLVAAAVQVHLRLGKLYNHFLSGEKVDYCIFSEKVMQAISSWLGEAIWPGNFADWRVWLAGCRRDWLFQVVSAALAAAIYFILLNGNKCCFDNSCYSVSKIDHMIRFSVKARVLNFNSRKLSSRERQMLEFVTSL